MKKLGFTLSELLITLGIIGVVSALTIPTLVSDTTSAQIGPKLAKAAAVFEQANQAMLSANSSDSITDARLNTGAVYANNLSRFLKMTPNNLFSVRSAQFTSKDGFRYNVEFGNFAIDTSLPAYQQRIGTIRIDIDPPKEIAGTSYFQFSLWNDGSLRPTGGLNWDGTPDSRDGGPEHWKTQCPKAEDGDVQEGFYCTGHIFENNLKVLYK